MTDTPSSARQRPAATHPRPVIIAHWVTVIVLLLVFSLILGRELLDQDALRAILLNGHRAAGLAVGALAIARLGLRSRYALAPTGAGTPLWQRLAAGLVHVAVYLLLLALPLLGCLLTNARGQLVSLPGLGSLPVLLARDLDLADTLELVHATIAWALLGLVVMHMAAALWHHRVRRDGVLVAMWPSLRRT
ncbi:MAG: cytochrome b [Leptothrix sp. (in: b-proteobacteria)]